MNMKSNAYIKISKNNIVSTDKIKKRRKIPAKAKSALVLADRKTQAERHKIKVEDGLMQMAKNKAQKLKNF